METKAQKANHNFDNGNFELISNNGQIYQERKDGFWSITRNNEFGKEKSYRDSTGRWASTKFDDRGNEIGYEDSDEFECKMAYDDRGNELEYKELKVPTIFLKRNIKN